MLNISLYYFMVQKRLFAIKSVLKTPSILKDYVITSLYV